MLSLVAVPPYIRHGMPRVLLNSSDFQDAVNLKKSLREFTLPQESS
jgi:hypothetical protein